MSLLNSWFQEKQSAWLYRVIAAAENNRRMRRLFRKLAEQADTQAALWESRLKAEGSALPPFKPTPRARLIGRLVRAFGPKALRPVLASMKIRGLSAYSGQGLETRHAMPTSAEDVGRRHKGVAGGNLRAAVFGVNDGLLSNTSLILGMAGASTGTGVVAMAGIAGLLAGALSMAAGEYVSMRSQRELFEYQIDLERAEFAMFPEEEVEELAVIYAARGMSLQQARRATRQMMSDPENALDLLAREELGVNPDDLGSPWGAALFSFLAFSGGASIPLIPFLLGFDMHRGVQIAGLSAGASLFAIGACLSLFTGRSALLGGLRMVLIGGIAGIVTYAIGSLIAPGAPGLT
ncbi:MULTISPECIES: VIT1/CCC1 transporter family protein [Methylocaldum]|uniref:VIT1/CCC1 transporter family protein n=1 Tax=Methylocaldum sp. RMAD-M TaxID=2806557 RepID=UPI001AE1585A|nr:VIT1/CCC1 transporter family protein [Methylocaldum sp. RMAD-M]MBP1150724.1 VIT1/CCC1 family predicted Fe2+/Mn2+ transporter [Methylocaldum sp. RMAD-M]